MQKPIGLALILLVVACHTPTTAPADPADVPIDDTRPTAQLESDTGHLVVIFDVVNGVAPDVPLYFAIDRRASEPIRLPIGTKVYAVSPGAHQYTVALNQSTCGMNAGGTGTSDSVLSPQSVLVSDRYLSTVYVQVDCSSVLTHWGVRSSLVGSPGFDSWTIHLNSPEFGSRDVIVPTDGSSVNFGPIHVGWYHFTMSGVPANCWGLGINSVNLPAGWVGPVTDSLQIRGVSGIFGWTFHCS